MKRLILALLLVPRLALGAVAYDASSSKGETGQSSSTFSHTVTGSNTLLLCGVVTTGTISGVTYNAVAMTPVDSALIGGPGVTLYRLIGAATGAHSVVVTLSGTSNIATGCMSFTGVHQTTPLGTQATDTEIGDLSASIAIPSGGMGASVAFGGSDRTSGNTERYFVDNGDASLFAFGSTSASTGSVAMTWTFGSAAYTAMVAVPINQSAAAPSNKRVIVTIAQ